MKSPIRRTLKLVLVLSQFFVLANGYCQNLDEIYVSTECNKVFKVNVKTCESKLVIDTDLQFLDIAFNPIDKKLYGVESDGTLWFLSPRTGITRYIGPTSAGMNALTFTSQGELYGMSRVSLDLFVINTTNGQATSLGKISELSYSAGDINFYRGELYLFALDRKVVKIDLNDISRSRTIARTSLIDVFGATSAGCESNFYVSSDFNLYEISNLDFQRPLNICPNVVPCIIFGATSLVENVGELNFGPDRALCVGEEVRLYGTPDAISYKWQDGSAGSSFLVTQSGEYWVELTNACSTTSDTIEITYNPFPEVEVTEDLTFCEGRKATLEVSGNNDLYAYKWNTGAENSSIEVNRSGLFTVSVSLGNCTVSESISAEKVFCETILTLPNIFSPNGDFFNELFVPIKSEEIASMQTIIFDRTGNKIFETDDLGINWDGKLPNGREAADGAYFWWISYTNFLEETKEVRGTLVLTR